MNDLDDTYLPAVPDDDGRSVVPYAPGSAPFLPDASGNESAVDLLADIGAPPQSAVQVFGQPLSAGVTAEAAQRDLDALTNDFTQAMQQQRIPQQHTDAAVGWFRRAAAGTVPREWHAHPYNLDGLSFPREDQPYTTAFCNAMHKQRVPQPVVRQMLGWYAQLLLRLQAQQQPQQQHQQEFTDAELDAIDARAEDDREAGMNALRIAWGHEMPARLGLVQRYMKNLPEREREHIENAVLPGGRMAGNDPNVIMKFYDEATGGHLPSGSNLQQEIDVLEARMKNDRRAWFKDDAAQARLRRLYQQRDGG